MRAVRKGGEPEYFFLSGTDLNTITESSLLRPERTLTSRVAELERKVAEHDRRIAALERGDMADKLEILYKESYRKTEK